MAVGVFIRSDKVALKGRHPLFSRVRQTFRQLPLSARPPRPTSYGPCPRVTKAGPRGGGAGWAPRAGGDALRKPLSNEGPELVQNSKAGPSDTRRLSERVLLGHLFGHHLLSSPLLQLDSPAIAVICDLSELPLWASVFPTVCDLTEGCVPNTGSRKAPPSTLNTGSSAP